MAQRLVETRASANVWRPRVCIQSTPLCTCTFCCHRSDLIYSSYDSSEVGLITTTHKETDAQKGKAISQCWGGGGRAVTRGGTRAWELPLQREGGWGQADEGERGMEDMKLGEEN